MNDSLLLIDGNNLLFRAYHGWAGGAPTPEARTAQTAVGFIALLLRPVREFRPARLAVVFDAEGPSFRHEANATYKANRPQREPDGDPDRYIPIVRDLLRRMGVVTCVEAGVEADDVIASTAVEGAVLGPPVFSYSNDRDFLQLVSPEISVQPSARNLPLYTPEQVWQSFHVRPDQFVDYKALQGDVSDNLPGVPGIGPKTAAALLQQHETVEELYERLWLVPEKLARTLQAHRERVWHNREMITLRSDLPLPFSLRDCTIDSAFARLNPFDVVRDLAGAAGE